MRNILIYGFFSTVATAALLAGCKPGPDHATGADAHEHEEKTAQISVWTDSYEVFAEHQAPVAQKITTFITHVTDLNTLEPRREGTVTFKLRQGDTAFEHTHPKPARAGIYLPGISFPKAGDWQVSLIIPAGGTNATVELGTIKVYADEHTAAHADIPDAPEGVSFLKEQQWKILSKIEPVRRRQVVQRVRAAAQVRSIPGQSASVKPPLTGQLMAHDGYPFPQLGQRIEAGQLLAMLKPSFSEVGAKVVEARAEFNLAKAAMEQAETAYQRVKKLAGSQAKSERELQEAELAYALAKTRHAAAVGLLGTFKQAGESTKPDAPLLLEVRAPISGVVNSVMAGIGEIVSPDQVLLSIVNADKVWIEARIPEASLDRLSSTKAAALELPGRAGQFKPVTGAGLGRFLSLGLEVDAATRTVPLIYEVSNADSTLRLGQRVTLHIETAEAKDAVVVPDAALVEEGGQLIAFVQVSGETFEKREVKVGIRDAGYVQVLEGIKEGERVVTKGAYAIRLSSISGVIPAHGHAH